MHPIWPAQVTSVGMMEQNMINYACLSGEGEQNRSVHVEVRNARAEKSLTRARANTHTRFWNLGD